MIKDYYNEIIPPWDPRYGKLGHMWKRLKKYRYGSGRNTISYFIPKELVLNEYLSAKIEVTKSETGWDWNNIVSSRVITRLLDQCCNLSKQEYFDLIDLKINNRLNRPRCANCKSILNFNQLSNGYSHHMYTTDYSETCCSLSCSLIYQNELNTGMNSIESNIRKARTQFINKGSLDDECYFYLAITNDNKLKYGITADIISRPDIEYLNNNSYKTIHLIYSDSRLNIANFETKIKLKFNGKEYIEFDNLSTLIKLIRSTLSDQ